MSQQREGRTPPPNGPVQSGLDVAPTATPTIPRMTLRLDDLAAALGVSRRAVERERAAGRFPKPDLLLGRMPLWKVETIRAWIERGGRT